MIRSLTATVIDSYHPGKSQQFIVAIIRELIFHSFNSHKRHCTSFVVTVLTINNLTDSVKIRRPKKDSSGVTKNTAVGKEKHRATSQQ